MNAVDFGLDDELGERDFEGKGFDVPSEGELLIGFRLNLTETGAQLNFAELPQGSGGSAPLASVSYTFAVAA